MTDTSTSIGGTVAPGYEPVAEAFARNFSHHGDVGAALCVYRHGEVVVDLWGGVEDPATGNALRARHPATGVLEHQGGHRAVRQPAGAAR